MNITEMLGTPVDDPTDFETTHPSACRPPRPPETLPPLRRNRNRLVGAVLVATSLIVGVAGGWYIASRPATALDHPVATSVAPQAPARVGAFAEMFTALYLSGTTPAEDLATMYAGPASPGTGTWINQTAALRMEPNGDGFWVVTVAADSLESIDGTYESAGIQYFELTVSEQDPYPVAISAPSRIPAPVTPSRNGVPEFNESVPADQADAIAHFIDGYLTNHEDAGRYVTSTAQIQMFAEPPYESISIESMGSDSLGNVHVSIVATTGRGAVHSLGYTLEMSFEAGVWEVSDLASVAHSR